MLRRKVLKFAVSELNSSLVQQKWCSTIISRNSPKHLQRLQPTGALQQKLGIVQTIDTMKHRVHSSSNQIQFEVKPAGFLLVDEELEIILRGLTDRQIVTVHAVLKDEKKVYESCAVFEADKDGVVNLASQPSRSGIYAGVSSMGLFWSMVPAPGQQKGIRLMKKNMDTPFKTVLYVLDGEHSLEDIHKSEQTPLNVFEIERWYKGQDVTTEMVRDGNIRGKLFLPKGPGPHQGIIDLFGTVGGLTEHRAALFASRGFAALALPYFAYEDLPKSLWELNLDYFLEAVDWMLSHKNICSKGVGVIGTSKGGDISLLMGANSPKVSAIVNVNGCTFNASLPLKYSGGDIPEVELRLDKLSKIDDACVWNTAHDYGEKDLIPVWRYNPKVLHILSEDDYCSPKECIPLMKRCYPPDKTDNCTVLAYDKAGHLVEPPYSALCRMSYHKSFDMYFMWGGFPEEHAKAQEHAWNSILTFFDQNIPKTSLNDSFKSNL